MSTQPRALLGLVVACLALSACKQSQSPEIFSTVCVPPETLPGGLPPSLSLLTEAGQIVGLDPATGTVSAAVAVTGLAMGETLVGIDYRPADGALIGVARNGSAGALYRIDPTSGAATALTTETPLTLSGARFGVDFNPVPGALRIVSDAGENLRLTFPTPESYAVNVDGTLNPASPVLAAAYTNSYTGAPVTTLYLIDANGRLLTQGGVDGVDNPNSGALAGVGSLGVRPESLAGFDVDGLSGMGLAALVSGGESRLYGINLGSGAATCLGAIALEAGSRVAGLAIPTPQPAVAFGLVEGNALVRFTPNAAGVAMVSAPVGITGLAAEEVVVGLDVRPASGALVALTVNPGSGAGAVYEVNAQSSAATLVPANADSAALMFDTAAVAYGVDFNPVPGALRIVNDAGQNLRLAFPAGMPGYTVNVDSALNPTGARSMAAAYTQNFAGTAATRLYVLDAGDATLRVQSPPNDGTQSVVGALGVNPTDGSAGFDIIGGAGVSASGANQGDAVSYAALNIDGSTRLFRINLATGAATAIGDMPVGGASPVLLRGLAVRVVRR